MRLEREFAGAVQRPAIAEVVRRSRQDLDGPHPAALPELVERLARQRLLQGGSPGCSPSWPGAAPVPDGPIWNGPCTGGSPTTTPGWPGCCWANSTS